MSKCFKCRGYGNKQIDAAIYSKCTHVTGGKPSIVNMGTVQQTNQTNQINQSQISPRGNIVEKEIKSQIAVEEFKKNRHYNKNLQQNHY